MLKYIFTALILGAAIGLLVLGLPPVLAAPPYQQASPLFSLKAEDITKIQAKGENLSVLITRTAHSAFWLRDKVQVPDSNRVTDTVKAVLAMTGTVVDDNEASKISTITPTLEITLTARPEGGQLVTQSLRIFGSNLEETGSYARKIGDPPANQLYLLSLGQVEYIKRSLDSLSVSGLQTTLGVVGALLQQLLAPALACVLALVFLLVAFLWFMRRRGKTGAPQRALSPAGPYLEGITLPNLKFDLTKDWVTVGRAPDRDLQITPQFAGWDTVSRQHAHFERRGERWVIVDGGEDGTPSSNGIFVNGKRTSENYLAEGFQIGFGEVLFSFHSQRFSSPLPQGVPQ